MCFDRKEVKMKYFRKETWISVFLIVFAVLCVAAFWMTSDNMHNPAFEVENQKITADRVEEIDKATEIYYLSLDELNVNNNTMITNTIESMLIIVLSVAKVLPKSLQLVELPIAYTGLS